MAHALTTLRLLLIGPLVLALVTPGRGAAWGAAGVLALAIASDLLDGPVARARGTASAFGRSFDHTVDFGFVAAGLVTLAALDVIPALLPVLVALAFGQYVVDSYVLSRDRTLRMSALGRWNGILYFVPPCTFVLARLGLPFPGLASGFVVSAIAWALVASTLLSIGDRLLAIRRPIPGAPDSRAA